jgi:PAS domain S-box-containing protein
MPLLHSAELVVCGILFAAGLLHALIAFRHQDRRMHLFFALTALAASGECLASAWRYHPADAAAMLSAIRLSSSLQFLFGIFLIWFVSSYTNLGLRTLLWLLTASTVLMVLLQYLLPYGLMFTAMPSIRWVALPWGEEFASPVVPVSRLIWLPHLTSFGLVCYVVLGCLHLWRTGAIRKAAYLAWGLAPLVLIAWPHGLLVFQQVLSSPYSYSFAFLSLVLIMTFRLTDDAVSVSRLARTVEHQERRWRTLLEHVQLLVVGCTQDGLLDYVNPFCLRTTAYSGDELLGRRIDILFDKQELPAASAVVEQMLAGEPVGHPKLRIRTKDGGSRTVVCSGVTLFGDDGSISGMLSIAADITEQENAEAARDEAIRQLEEMAARLEGENLYLKQEMEVRSGPKSIVGTSPPIRYVVHQAQLVAKTRAAVLIEGETGVGKELVARSIHDMSDRAAAPFIGINCAAITATLVEAELFGSEKGAYTGADRTRKGRFELADGGTLFLDEVGELSLEVQAKLLRVLQEGEFERVGGQQTRRADVRIISATNRDLAAEVAAGRFREDLYYRLRIFPITVPPLRERREDIPLLVQHYAESLAARHGRDINQVPAPVMNALCAWSWPGNVRELANVIERAVISSNGPLLMLPPDFARAAPATPAKAAASNSLLDVERNHILATLRQTNWKIHGPGGAAEALGLHPNTLRSRMQKMGISKRTRAAEEQARPMP